MPPTSIGTRQRILRSRTTAVALLCLAALPRCTCADMRRNQAYNEAKRAGVEDHIHIGTRADIASDVVSLLTDRGYSMPPWTGTGELRTEWHGQGEKVRDRMHVTVTEATPGFRVVTSMETQTLSEPKYRRKSRDRDTDLQAAVLEHVSPGTGASLTPSQIADFAYELPSKELWDAVTEQTRARGHYFSTFDPPVDVTASSRWEVLESDETSRVRYDVQLARVDAKHLQLQVHRTVEEATAPPTWATTDNHRDIDTEFELIRHRTPEVAASIETEASNKGQEAYDKAVERREFWCNVAESSADKAN